MSGAYSILQQPWWWDATALRGWEEAKVEVDGRVVARWPYSRMNAPLGLNMLAAPPLTNRAGPWIQPVEGKQSTRYGRTGALLDQLLDQMPPSVWFAQNLHPQLDYWMPLFWRGFQIEARATYMIHDCRDSERLEADLEEAARRQVRKGRRSLGIEEIGAGRLIDLVRKTFKRQGHGMRVPPAVLESIMAAVTPRGAGRAVAALDGAGRVHAAALFVWDDTTMYYLVGGGDPELRSSGAGTFIMFEGMEDAGRRGLAFDFEGSMLPGVERFFRGFGAVQNPYIRVSRGSSMVRAGMDIIRKMRRA